MITKNLKGINVEITIKVTDEFIKQRAANSKLYNQTGRTDRKFWMDLDCEIVEHTFIANGEWSAAEGWETDAVIDGKNVDLKFVQKYWNISPRRIVNIIRQRKIIDEYHFYEWVERPKRPLEPGDEVTVQFVGAMTYDQVADNIKASYKQAGGHYVDIRSGLSDQ